MKFSTLPLTILAASLTSVVTAATLYDNGAPDNVNAFRSDFASNNGGPSSTDTQQVSDDFSLAGPSTVNSVGWWGLYAFQDTSVPLTDNFTIRIFADAAGMPSTAPLFQFAVGNSVNRVDTGIQIQGFEQFSYTATLPATLLGAGSYWLSVLNNSTGQTNDWFWSTSNDSAGDAMNRDTEASPWAPAAVSSDFPNGFETAFNIGGAAAAAPDAGSSALLLGLALAALFVVKRASSRRLLS
jgi:hypothetical protein